MGKSNKFDYHAKKNTGVGLGRFVGGQLVKEADKIQKDAERKARKQSTDSSATGSDTKEPHVIQSIDLQVPDKELTDEGFSPLADGLQEALEAGTELASLALEELNLGRNGLTTAALARLAPIIKLAHKDLKMLDLTNNSISVRTNEEALQWETFLRSFSTCYKPRRIDLSGNTGLGGRAIEVLARVHLGEPEVEALVRGQSMSVQATLHGPGHATINMLSFDGACDDDDEETPQFTKSFAAPKNGQPRQGLRSVPFITLHDIGLNDVGALWLSYVLEDHHYPSQLTDELTTNASGMIQTRSYLQGIAPEGVDWSENRSLSREASNLLQKTEMVRKATLLDRRDSVAGAATDGENLNAGRAALVETAASNQTARTAGYRRTSLRSSHDESEDDHGVSGLDSLRKKMQRHIIELRGFRDIELWRTALDVVKCSRMLFILAPTDRKLYTGEAMFQLPVTAMQPRPKGNYTTQKESSGHRKQLSIDVSKAKAGRKGSYAAKLAVTPTTPGEPELAITEVTNTPTTPRMVFKAHRKGGFSEGADLVNEKLNGLILRDDDPQRFVKRQLDRIAKAGGQTAFRDSTTLSHLPRPLLDRVMSLAVGDRYNTVMSEEQQRRAVEWGQRRESLTFKQEWKGKDESFKMWVMLDSIKCLAYGQ